MSATDDARQILDGVIGRNDPSHVFALFSGGHDSLCSTHLASLHPRFGGVVHVNTQIGIERTRVFVRETCASYGWPLAELTPPAPAWAGPGETAYEAIVRRWGFPGPGGHTLIYNRLKERCLRRLLRDHRDGRRKVVLVTGVRRKESARRMGHIVAEQHEGRRVWCAPLVEWDDRDKREYQAANCLPVNEVALKLCMSGECLCGAFARPEERAEIKAVCPETEAYISRLELRVREAGQPNWRWGHRPAKARRSDQPELPFLPMCVSCETKLDRAS